MNLHPHLTRTEYQALRRKYREARRADDLAASRMPVLSSEWRRQYRQLSTVACIAASVDPWLAETLERRTVPARTFRQILIDARRARLSAERGRTNVMARAIAQIAAYEAQRVAA